MPARKKLRVVIVAIVLLGAGGGYAWWSFHREKPAEDELTLFGNVDVRQVELAINGNERIAELHVEEGDFVHKGDLLARLELARFQFAVLRAEAQLQSQQQVVARLKAGSRPEEIRKAKADWLAAQATLKDAERSLKRVEKAYQKKAVTQQELDDARAAYEKAEALEKAAKATYDLVLAGPRKEDIAQAEALEKRYEAELAAAKHDLEDASLYAPNDGIVQNRLLEVGDMASPLKPVFTLALTNPLWVRAYVTEPDLGKIREGMRAVVITDSFPGKEYEGWVGFISPTAEFTPRPVETEELRTKLVYQVRVYVKNPNFELRLGMPATVRIPLNQAGPSAKP